MTMGDHVRRRVVQKEPAWRIAPADPLTPSHDPTAHIGTSLVAREPRQQVRTSLGEHGEIWFFCCAIRRCPGEGNTRSDVPGGGNVAVQRIHSSNLAISVNRAVDGLLPLPGDLRNTRDG